MFGSVAAADCQPAGQPQSSASLDALYSVCLQHGLCPKCEQLYMQEAVNGNSARTD